MIHPLRIAHRGASAQAPENTLAALEMAIQEGVDLLEIDVRASADGEVVVIHDPTLDRTTDRTGLVAELTYDEILKEIKLGLQECGRKLGVYIRKGKRLKREYEKRSYIEKYIPHIGIALQEILELSDSKRDKTVETLEDVLHKSRKF